MFSVYTQLSNALLYSFKADFGPYEEEIARKPQRIRDEAYLASQQALKQEYELQAKERSDTRSHRSACVVAKLIEKVLPKDVAAYFVCRFDETESLKAKTTVGRIARQLLSNFPATVFAKFNLESTDGTSIISALEAMLSDNRKYFIVLDGLDECGEKQIKEVDEIFHGFLLSSHLQKKSFWTSRPNVLGWLSGRFLTEQRINIETVENQSRVAHDISIFVVATLEEWLDGEAPEL